MLAHQKKPQASSSGQIILFAICHPKISGNRSIREMFVTFLPLSAPESS